MLGECEPNPPLGARGVFEGLERLVRDTIQRAAKRRAAAAVTDRCRFDGKVSAVEYERFVQGGRSSEEVLSTDTFGTSNRFHPPCRSAMKPLRWACEATSSPTCAG